MTVTIIALHAFEIYNNKVEEKLFTGGHLISHIPILRHVSSKERTSFFLASNSWSNRLAFC